MERQPKILDKKETTKTSLNYNLPKYEKRTRRYERN